MTSSCWAGLAPLLIAIYEKNSIKLIGEAGSSGGRKGRTAAGFVVLRVAIGLHVLSHMFQMNPRYKQITQTVFEGDVEVVRFRLCF